MRNLTIHKTNGLNEKLDIEVLDQPGQGNACHKYAMYCRRLPDAPDTVENVTFQEGPIKEVGTNGTSNEALLAIVRDRLQGFQSGPYACRENAIALTKIEEALQWLHWRTRARTERGVEGTHTV